MRNGWAVPNVDGEAYRVAEAQARLRDAKVVPPGYAITWGGQFENLEAASDRLAVAVPAALLHSSRTRPPTRRR